MRILLHVKMHKKSKFETGDYMTSYRQLGNAYNVWRPMGNWKMLFQGQHMPCYRQLGSSKDNILWRPKGNWEALCKRQIFVWSLISNSEAICREQRIMTSYRHLGSIWSKTTLWRPIGSREVLCRGQHIIMTSYRQLGGALLTTP